MSVLLVILGLLLGGAIVALLLRRVDSSQQREHERERLRDELQALSVDALRQTGDSLADRLEQSRRLEHERATSELAQRNEEFKGIVRPMQEKLGRMESEIARLERERRDAHVQLAQMMRTLGDGVGVLRQETGNLAAALKRPSTRGSWGEIQLRNAVEMAGMVAHCDFVEQRTIHGEEGALRPDMLVRLPGGKVIVVDSKVPLDAYLAAVETDGEDERERHMARHARQTREHISKLAAKGYHARLEETPEFVVMFVPSDGIYQSALAADATLIEFGARQHVLIATPTTLIGLLWATHYGWREERIAESAREIAESARELHRRLGRFVEPLAKVGRQLDSATAAYNEAVGSFDARVIPQVRKIEAAGAASDRAVDKPSTIETAARAVTAQLDSDAVESASEDRPARALGALTLADESQSLDALDAPRSARIAASEQPSRRSA